MKKLVGLFVLAFMLVPGSVPAPANASALGVYAGKCIIGEDGVWFRGELHQGTQIPTLEWELYVRDLNQDLGWTRVTNGLHWSTDVPLLGTIDYRFRSDPMRRAGRAYKLMMTPEPGLSGSYRLARYNDDTQNRQCRREEAQP